MNEALDPGSVFSQVGKTQRDPRARTMKKLPFCALSAGALFVVLGIGAIFLLTPGTQPFSLLFPLVWDLAMVGISLGIVFRSACARKAGLAWSVFCIVATLAVGVATYFWAMKQHDNALGRDRLVFLGVTIGFGVLFGLWQLLVLRSPNSVEAWFATSSRHRGHPPQVRHT